MTTTVETALIKRLQRPRMVSDDQPVLIDPGGVLTLSAHPIRVRLRLAGTLSEELVRRLVGDERVPLEEWLDALTQALPSGVDVVAVADGLVRAGVVLEDAGVMRSEGIDGEYLAWRLIAAYRRTMPALIAKNRLLRRLSANEGLRNLAFGLLLETYFVVRSAKWTGLPVLNHEMTSRQRALLTDFYATEADHGAMLATSLTSLGWSIDQLVAAPASPETDAYCLAYHGYATLGVNEFAAALILPEVAQYPTEAAARRVDLLELLEMQHGVPSSALAGFREHDCDDAEAQHALLPVELLAEAGTIAWHKALELRRVVDIMISLYGHHLTSVAERYAAGVDLEADVKWL